MVIWKFPLSLVGRGTIKMPKGSQILHVNQQDDRNGYDRLMLWAMCDPDAEMEDRDFIVAGTGTPIDNDYDMTYIGTVHLSGFVWHVFDRSATH